MFSPKISDLTQCFQPTIIGWKISTKTSDLTKNDFYNSIQLKMIKISTVSETQKV